MNDRRPSSPAAIRDIPPAARRVDQWMNHLIKIGGISIVTAVLAIFVFILWQIWPLFRSPSVEKVGSWPLPQGEYLFIGTDEWSALPFAVENRGELVFLEPRDGSTRRKSLPLPAEETPAAFRYHPKKQDLIVATDLGRVLFVHLDFKRDPDRPGRIDVEIEASAPIAVGRPGQPVIDVDLDGGAGQRMAALIQVDAEGRRRLLVTLLTQRRGLVGGGQWRVAREFDLTDQLPAPPRKVLLTERADSVVVLCEDGAVHYFARIGEELSRVQRFYPFPPDTGDRLQDAEYLFGDDSLVCWSERGSNVVYSLYNQPGLGRAFGRTKVFPPLPGRPTAYAKSVRNKAFALAGGGVLSLRYSTTERVRWESPIDYEPRAISIGPKYDSLWVLDSAGRLHRYALHDPHPEAGFRAFFGKIWYEGAPQPDYAWQSTGGADEFEPKLSMVPLLIGTLKGTLYALLFSVPVALTAALYTSQFAHPNFRRFIKPTMEVMASLPSVILGFIAALWLAPRLEQRVPSLFLTLAALPAAALTFGALWSRLPFAIRRHLREGWEFLYLAPLMAVVGYLSWRLGPSLEDALFLARDPATGATIPDFRLWWIQTTGLSFEQRNSLVVGLMMGFAVIPIIFTIAEDALSNVPPAFRSASLALGATRWQTAVRVVLPTASAGIFSAIMIGFGRAVGETMIVLMATGNTPIMDFNIFSGMRTLSANIAVELPEAPHHSTLYRALFLGAMLLFLMTFAVNTLAEVLRHRLREKYKAV